MDTKDRYTPEQYNALMMETIDGFIDRGFEPFEIGKILTMALAGHFVVCTKAEDDHKNVEAFSNCLATIRRLFETKGLSCNLN